MSDSIHDLVVDDGLEYRIAGISGRGLFQPEHHGLVLPAPEREPGRIHRCRYKLWEDCLLLDALFVRSDAPPPALEHHLPAERPETEPAFAGFDYVYAELDLAVPYSGGLLLAREPIDEPVSPVGSHPATVYRTVVELIVEDGLVTSRADRSSRLAELRRKIAQRAAQSAALEDTEPFSSWLDAGFIHDYRR